MTSPRPSLPLGRIVAIAAVLGVVVGLVCVGVLTLLNLDVSSGVVGAIAGGVTGAVIPVVVKRQRR